MKEDAAALLAVEEFSKIVLGTAQHAERTSQDESHKPVLTRVLLLLEY